jgi:hypothetical protein
LFVAYATSTLDVAAGFFLVLGCKCHLLSCQEIIVLNVFSVWKNFLGSKGGAVTSLQKKVSLFKVQGSIF